MKEYYLKRAAENMPQIFEKKITPKTSAFSLHTGDEILIDLGNHYVGYFSFKMKYVDIYIDAPVKLSVKFCETKREIEDDFAAYNGSLCSSWLQEEIINIDFPGEYKMPRRYAARYVVIKVMATPQTVSLFDFAFTAVTSADDNKPEPVALDSELASIDTVALNTLKNCMQRVFEDGPKRDRRLWTGDLRLEALANYSTFKNLALTKRCLYLFAAADTNNKGFIPGYVYENPGFVSGSWFLEDYALLFVRSACEYYVNTGDKETFFELYPAIARQMEAMHNTVDSDGIASVAEGCDAFIDWCNGLKKITALHGVYLYVLKMLAEVLESLGHSDRALYSERYGKAKKSAENVLYDKDKNAFLNKKDDCQYSVHSAVWMILGGVTEGDEAKALLLDALNSNESLKPFTPYMHHYVVEAMIELGMLDETREYIKKYWGAMVSLGADTFYEVFVPNDSEFSPYGDRMMNSMCHAWSCTPTYFIRNYFKAQLK